jgi:hypothetical protein
MRELITKHHDAVQQLELPVPDCEHKLSEDGGHGGMGDVARGVVDDEGRKTDEIEGHADQQRPYTS